MGNDEDKHDEMLLAHFSNMNRLSKEKWNRKCVHSDLLPSTIRKAYRSKMIAWYCELFDCLDTKQEEQDGGNYSRLFFAACTTLDRIFCHNASNNKAPHCKYVLKDATDLELTAIACASLTLKTIDTNLTSLKGFDYRINNFIQHISGKRFTPSQVYSKEVEVLEALQFDITLCPTAIDYLSLLSTLVYSHLSRREVTCRQRRRHLSYLLRVSRLGNLSTYLLRLCVGEVRYLNSVPGAYGVASLILALMSVISSSQYYNVDALSSFSSPLSIVSPLSDFLEEEEQVVEERREEVRRVSVGREGSDGGTRQSNSYATMYCNVSQNQTRGSVSRMGGRRGEEREERRDLSAARSGGRESTVRSGSVLGRRVLTRQGSQVTSSPFASFNGRRDTPSGVVIGTVNRQHGVACTPFEKPKNLSNPPPHVTVPLSNGNTYLSNGNGNATRIPSYLPTGLHKGSSFLSVGSSKAPSYLANGINKGTTYLSHGVNKGSNSSPSNGLHAHLSNGQSYLASSNGASFLSNTSTNGPSYLSNETSMGTNCSNADLLITIRNKLSRQNSSMGASPIGNTYFPPSAGPMNSQQQQQYRLLKSQLRRNSISSKCDSEVEHIDGKGREGRRSERGEEREGEKRGERKVERRDSRRNINDANERDASAFSPTSPISSSRPPLITTPNPNHIALLAKKNPSLIKWVTSWTSVLQKELVHRKAFSLHQRVGPSYSSRLHPNTTPLYRRDSNLPGDKTGRDMGGRGEMGEERRDKYNYCSPSVNDASFKQRTPLKSPLSNSSTKASSMDIVIPVVQELITKLLDVCGTHGVSHTSVGRALSHLLVTWEKVHQHQKSELNVQGEERREERGEERRGERGEESNISDVQLATWKKYVLESQGMVAHLSPPTADEIRHYLADNIILMSVFHSENVLHKKM